MIMGRFITWIIAITAIVIAVVSLVKNFSREGPPGIKGEKGVQGDEGKPGLMTMEQVEQYLIANDYITQEKLQEKLQDGTVELNAVNIKADTIEAAGKIKTDIIEPASSGYILLDSHLNVGGRARINMEGKAGNGGDYLNVFTADPSKDEPIFLVGLGKKSGMWENGNYCSNSSEC